MADNREGQMKATQNVKVRFAILGTAAVLCVGVIPSWAHSWFGQSPQNDDSKRGSQDPRKIGIRGRTGTRRTPAILAAEIDVKPGSRIQFTLESPFTFEPPQVNAARQQ